MGASCPSLLWLLWAVEGVAFDLAVSTLLLRTFARCEQVFMQLEGRVEQLRNSFHDMSLVRDKRLNFGRVNG